MLKLITGLPGSFKTANVLDYFLFNEEIKHRPKFATHINGLDYDKHNITKIEDLTDWMSFPDGSIVLVDEAQQFLRPRKKEQSLPAWVAGFETHRHRGMDFIATTQHPMLLDVHFRRLVGEHTDLKRVSGFKRVAHRVFQRCMDEPNDFHALKEAQTTIKKVNPRVFSEYESTQLDTHKFKMPTKLLYWGSFVALMFGFSIYMGYPIFSRWFGVAQNAKMPTAVQSASNSVATDPMSGQTLLQPSQSGDPMDRPIIAADFQPATPLAPWTAPIYRKSVNIESVPHFSGCISTPKKCSCYTQQGTSLDVDMQTCMAVIEKNNMPFNPFKKDSDDKPYNPLNENRESPSFSVRTDSIVVGQTDTKEIEARAIARDQSWNNPHSSGQKTLLN